MFLKVFFFRFTVFTARIVFLLKYLAVFYKEKLSQTFRELYSLEAPKVSYGIENPVSALSKQIGRIGNAVYVRRGDYLWRQLEVRTE